MKLTTALWDRLAYHALLPLCGSVARAAGMTAEHLVLGTGWRVQAARAALTTAMVCRAGWPLDAAVELLTGDAGGLVPVAQEQPAGAMALRPKRNRRVRNKAKVLRNTVTPTDTAQTDADNAAECSERWAA